MRKPADMLPIEVVVDDSPVTSHAGLVGHLELWRRLSMPEEIDRTVSICGSQGWTDRQMVLSLVLLNLAGGDCITDIDALESDRGLCEMVRGFERSTWSARERRASDSRFRSGRKRTFPAATQIATFLEACHDESSEDLRGSGKAYIPAVTEPLSSLRALNTSLVGRLQCCSAQSTATLDGDATLVETHTQTALYGYKGYRAYQPYNVWWAEQQLVLHSEFRDGNVPAGYEVTRVMKDALACLPDGVTKVYTRQDTAAYQTEFLAWCEREREHPEYGRILFTVSADISRELRSAIEKTIDWQPEMRMSKGVPSPTGREFAELMFVPTAQALLRDIPEPFRYIAIRERMSSQLSLLEGEESESDGGCAAPFPSVTMDRVRYKVHAIVTNRRDDDASELIRWHYERCGKSEEAHAIMKGDFAGGRLPSAKFGANAAWWALMILSMNLQRILSGLMGEGWTKKRMKKVRFALINTPGRLVAHARQLFLRVPEAVAHLIDVVRASVAALRPGWT